MINLRILKAAAKAKPTPALAPEAEPSEKMTRRAALRRLGMMGGMTVLGALTIDKLARISAQKLGQYELTSGLAKDFKNAGVAFADVLGGPSPSPRDMQALRRVPNACTRPGATCVGCAAALDARCRIFHPNPDANGNPDNTCALAAQVCDNCGLPGATAATLVACYRARGIID